MDNLDFDSIGEERAAWLEKDFEEEEVKKAICDLGKDKAPGPDGFPIAICDHFDLYAQKVLKSEPKQPDRAEKVHNLDQYLI